MKITELLLESLLLEDLFDRVKERFMSAGTSEEEAAQYIQDFRTLVNQHRVAGSNRDINNWAKRPFADFKSFVDQTKGTESKTAKIKRERSEEGNRIDLTQELGLSEKEWNVYIPLDKAAACFKTDKRTDWCVAKRDHDYFESYMGYYQRGSASRQFLIYFLRNDNQSAWAMLLTCLDKSTYTSLKENWVIDNTALYSKVDNEISEEYFRKKTGINPSKIETFIEPKIPQIFQQLDKHKEVSIPYRIAQIYHGSKEDPSLRDDILKSKNIKYVEDYMETTGKPIMGIHTWFMKTPRNVHDYAILPLKGAWSDPKVKRKFKISDEEAKRAEEVVSQDFPTAMSYVQNWGVRLPALEEKIVNNPNLAITYVESTNKPFPAAEPMFAKTAENSIFYAEILGKPFPLGEPAIATKANTAYGYATDILNNKRFKMGEKAIASNRLYAADYAVHVLKTAWSNPALNIDPATVALAEKNISKIDKPDGVYWGRIKKQYTKLLKELNPSKAQPKTQNPAVKKTK